MNKDYCNDKRFSDIKPFEDKIYLSSPTMHGSEMIYMKEAYDTNWMSSIGHNLDVLEEILAKKCNRKYCVALSSGTAALHMAIKVCATRIYGREKIGRGTLANKKVFCSDMTFDATVNPVVYENGEPVFIDSEYETWNMDPVALDKAFDLYPDVKLVIVANLYGTPAKLDEIRNICSKRGAYLIEDAAESLGATYLGKATGDYADCSILSFNGNKIITGTCGGAFLTDIKEDADRVRKWSTQSRQKADWYQHEELGYNYRMSNLIAGVIRGQMESLDKHISQKKKIYNTYKAAFSNLPVKMNPYMKNSEPNYWLSCMTIDKEAMCPQVRGDLEALYVHETSKSCPSEMLDVLKAFNAEGRPIWKPMHMQPIYRSCDFISAMDKDNYACEDIFNTGLCLPSDNKMTEEQIEVICKIISRCFD